MSQTSRSAPGNRQGRNNYKGTNRYKSAIATKRIDESRRAAIHEIGDSRRASVYREDAEYTPDDAQLRALPARGTPERAALIAEIVRLRRTGLSHLKISCALDPMRSATTVCNLLREAGEK